jgi:hypothetical protein
MISRRQIYQAAVIRDTESLAFEHLDPSDAEGV